MLPTKLSSFPWVPSEATLTLVFCPRAPVVHKDVPSVIGVPRNQVGGVREEELTEFPETEVRLVAASRPETLRHLAVTLLGLSDESLDAVLNLACQMRYLEGLPVE